ncbi:FAD-dependent oxidoreductase [Gymnodinialimonas hymeniacidonis]|uniref:FAD-binding oxidoreductase n=1 Tax=Gymnodinialimonas hymeniacidonis TaxID=3126508 RepID=UPI0034C63CD0
MAETKDRPEPPSIGSFRAARETLKSFDGGESADVHLYAPDRIRFFDDTKAATPRIARGAGLSYCAASFLSGGNTISHGAFNRVLDFDSETGEVEVEAGIDLGTLYRFLAPRGRHLPCHPGYGAITVGGCVAADVHGKNHVRDGTFVRQVVGLSLFHPSHGLLDLARDKLPDLFELTCGGFGLTGHIMTVRLRTEPLNADMVERSSKECETFFQTIEQLEHVQKTSDFAYSWHDMSRPGDGFGAGIVHWGRIVPNDKGGDGKPIGRENRSSIVSRWPVRGLVGYRTTALLAKIYRAKTRRADDSPLIPHYDAVFPIHGSERYFALFGMRGFHEAQWLFPKENLDAVIAHLEGAVRNNRLAIALASAKVFDDDVSLLRYSGKGISLAINLPRSPNSSRALADLDRLMLTIGGRPNLIKDGRLSAKVVEDSCPDIGVFRQRLKDFDPDRVFRSELSERLAL